MAAYTHYIHMHLRALQLGLGDVRGNMASSSHGGLFGSLGRVQPGVVYSWSKSNFHPAIA